MSWFVDKYSRFQDLKNKIIEQIYIIYKNQYVGKNFEYDYQVKKLDLIENFIRKALFDEFEYISEFLYIAIYLSALLINMTTVNNLITKYDIINILKTICKDSKYEKKDRKEICKYVKRIISPQKTKKIKKYRYLIDDCYLVFSFSKFELGRIYKKYINQSKELYNIRTPRFIDHQSVYNLCLPLPRTFDLVENIPTTFMEYIYYILLTKYQPLKGVKSKNKYLSYKAEKYYNFLIRICIYFAENEKIDISTLDKIRYKYGLK